MITDERAFRYIAAPFEYCSTSGGHIRGDLFIHPVFREAIDDLKSQGLRVMAQPAPGAQAYAIVGGRSNARWWLVPLQNRRVTASGMALFQPLLTSARLMKAAAGLMIRLCMNRLWVRQRLYISGEPSLGQYFPGTVARNYAYFTGTDSPHRKIAVQIMDTQGRLLGFAKLSRNPSVATLLAHEAAMLQRVQKLGLKTAYIPRVLFTGQHGDSSLIVMDTLKTARTSSTTRITAAHKVFLQELARTTALATPRQAGELAAGLSGRIERVRPMLEDTWYQRLDSAAAALAAQPKLPLSVGMNHGDFTPWNTFLFKGRLYVFDWEYAEDASPPSNDIIHFVLNEPRTRGQSARQKMAAAMSSLAEPWTGTPQQVIPALLIIYLLTQSLRQIERLPEDRRKGSDWDGAKEQAGMLDTLLTRH
ncbi:MAG: hypothetical protein VR64_22895 [Desulfatitalea sp. BRH_c12]|nr:MAG: hypothetical protein VR64_22895 [Desulfatitalea sp. BRH_c12]